MEYKEKYTLIILGPTGVGKSATAIRIAKRFNGEILSCDSMQVYRGFDIGTDKIPAQRREDIPHHLLDILEPSEQFTAAEFSKRAVAAIRSILQRNKLPIIAGGTGLYLKALIHGLFPEGKREPQLRERLQAEAENKGLEVLWEKLMKVDPKYAQKIGKNDRVRIIRALEVFTATQKPISQHFLNTKSTVSDFNIIRIGLKLDRDVLYKRIEDRIDVMFERGIVEEVQRLLESGVDEKAPPFRALGYKQVMKYIKNETTLEEAVQSTKTATRHYAKRQMTWFKKMEGIQWFSPHDISSITKYVAEKLK
ncbi:MAG: tRNA (adenosine(37)-N6)-dimethylallyltransferase MiaA [Candidatus Aminicenantes bacterium]|nr:tRNA (adenosine(37)-N6)-dimethylallyltransferase MiaA [Candidatus Aminicenantes bacterium]